MPIVNGSINPVPSLGVRTLADFRFISGYQFNGDMGEDIADTAREAVIILGQKAWNFISNPSKWRYGVSNEMGYFPIKSCMGKARAYVDTWVSAQRTFNVNHHKAWLLLEDVNVIPSIDYFATLDSLIDPDDYINLLALWPVSINLAAFIKGYGLTPDGAGFRWVGLPDVEKYRKDYSLYVKRFGEVILYRSLQEAAGILDITKTEDLDAVNRAHLFVQNRLIPRLSSLVNARYTFAHEGFRKGENLFSYIPMHKSPPLDFNTYDPSTYTLYSNAPDCSPNLWEPKPDSPTGGCYNFDPGGCCTVTYKDVDGNVLHQKTAREALLHEAEKALTLIKVQEVKLAGRTIQLMDKDAKIVQTSFSMNPYENPFLAYDASASLASGKPTFKNIAYNVSTNLEGKTPEYVTAKYGPTIEHYSKIDVLRSLHARNLVTSTGAQISPSDLIDLSDETRTNIAPWIIGGIATAAAISQVM